MIDYKFNYIIRDDQTQIRISLYGGAITTELETQPGGKLVSVTRYRRTKKLFSREFRFNKILDYIESVGEMNRIIDAEAKRKKVEIIREQRI